MSTEGQFEIWKQVLTRPNKSPVEIILNETSYLSTTMASILHIICFVLCRRSFIKRAIRHFPKVQEMLQYASDCAVCGQSFLNTWLECVHFVDAHKVRKISFVASCLLYLFISSADEVRNTKIN